MENQGWIGKDDASELCCNGKDIAQMKIYQHTKAQQCAVKDSTSRAKLIKAGDMSELEWASFSARYRCNMNISFTGTISTVIPGKNTFELPLHVAWYRYKTNLYGQQNGDYDFFITLSNITAFIGIKLYCHGNHEFALSI